MRGRKDQATGRQSGARAVVLIGFMGAGKSSVGRALAARLGWAFEDLDDHIERREGRKVHEIFRDCGEPGFRRAEREALKEILSELRSGTQKIVALGGGAFLQKQNARLIKAGGLATVFLDASVDELWRRCRQQAERQGINRPLLGSRESFCELHEERRPHYLKASCRQETGGKTVERIVAEVVQTLGFEKRGGNRGEKR